jgi:hypothetical protein
MDDQSTKTDDGLNTAQSSQQNDRKRQVAAINREFQEKSILI